MNLFFCAIRKTFSNGSSMKRYKLENRGDGPSRSPRQRILYRAPRIALTPLNIGRMTDSYSRIFSIDHKAALEMARKTKGYSFAFQVLGYFTWEYRNDPAAVFREYRQYLEEYVYEKIWQELSPEDRRVLYGIAKAPDGSVAEIRKYLKMSSNQFTPYRTRLIRRGIINGDAYGKVSFELPLFNLFVLDNYDADDEEGTADTDPFLYSSTP